MPLGINNIPCSGFQSECEKAGIISVVHYSFKGECEKAAKILASFVDPQQSFDMTIPPQILVNAKGLIILTVISNGFFNSPRVGSGVVVARLADGTWSAPSALATRPGDIGQCRGQIGGEHIELIFILNDTTAVRTFSQKGSLILGGNVSIAIGPVERNIEAAGAAILKDIAGIFAYSKTKGFFAGVSLEGSVIIEQRDANEVMYQCQITAKELLGGDVKRPPEAEPLMSVLNSRVFTKVATPAEE